VTTAAVLETGLSAISWRQSSPHTRTRIHLFMPEDNRTICGLRLRYLHDVEMHGTGDVTCRRCQQLQHAWL
jgi:hypothetical protein